MMRGAARALITLALAACSEPPPATDNTGGNIANAASSPSPAELVNLTEADKAGLDAAVDALYAPYRSEDGPADTPIERQLNHFSVSLADLVKRWRAAQPEREIDSVLAEADWFCQCQDWPGKGFKFIDKSYEPLLGGQVGARVRFDLGDGEPGETRLLFAREGTEWKLVDLFSPIAKDGVAGQLKSDLDRWEKK
jgi:hypothetical protein